MGRRRFVGIVALGGLAHDDAKVDHVAEGLDLGVGGSVGECLDGDEVVRGERCLDVRSHLGVGQLQGVAERGDRRLVVQDEVGHDADDGQVGVDRQRFAVTVVDRAAAGDALEEVHERGVVEGAEVERRRPEHTPLLVLLRLATRLLGRHGDVFLHERHRVAVGEVSEERRVERDLERDLVVRRDFVRERVYARPCRRRVGEQLVVDAGDRRLFLDRGVAVDEGLPVDRQAGFAGDEAPHLVEAVVGPQLEPALGGLFGRRGTLGLCGRSVFAGAGDCERAEEGSGDQECHTEGHGEPVHRS